MRMYSNSAQTMSSTLAMMIKIRVLSGAESVETEGEEKEEGSMLDPDPEPKTTATRFVSVGDKVRRRIYAKSMRELQNIQRRSKETLDRLNFTVDLVRFTQEIFFIKHTFFIYCAHVNVRAFFYSLLACI